MEIDIGGKFIGPEQRVFLVAEVGQAHEGSLGIAHSYIDDVSDVGADARRRHVETFCKPRNEST